MRALRHMVVAAIWVVAMPVVMYGAMALVALGRGDAEEGTEGSTWALVGGGALFFGGVAAVLFVSGRVARWSRLADPEMEIQPPGH